LPVSIVMQQVGANKWRIGRDSGEGAGVTDHYPLVEFSGPEKIMDTISIKYLIWSIWTETIREDMPSFGSYKNKTQIW